MATTEYADSRSRDITPLAGLSKRTGLPLGRIVELAEQRRLGELFDDHGHIGRPLTPQEALRRLEKTRCAPGDVPPQTRDRLAHIAALKVRP